MDGHSGAERGSRETFLALMLAALVAAGFGLLLFLICGGIGIAIIAVVGGVVALCLVNYFLWGHALLRSTAGEREDAEFQALLEDDGWNRPLENAEGGD
jgi:hypothetical protein